MKYSIATVCLSGTLEQKMHAAAKAGFHAIEIFENDLTQYRGSAADVKRIADSMGLDILVLQPFRDMEGMPQELRRKKYKMMERKMELAHQLGTKRLMMCSNVNPLSTNNLDRCAEDLYALAELAKREDMELGYEALAWGRHIADYDDAWNLVKMVDHPNLGVVLDTFHMFARGNTLDTLRNDIPVEKIALVQVADAPKMQMDILQYSRHYRCFPGQGDFPVIDFVKTLKDKGYDDYLSHEVFNDEFRSSSPKEKAVDGVRSLKWLEDQTDNLFEAPSVSDLSFIEFAVKDPEDNPFTDVIESLGFHKTHHHKSKNVDLYQVGDINLVFNYEKNSNARTYLEGHGESVCALGVLTKDSQRLVELAKRYNSPTIYQARQENELNIPTLKSSSQLLIHLLDENQAEKFYDVDFEPVENAQPMDDNFVRVDHIGQVVAPDTLLSNMFFYKSIFGFVPEESFDLPDINGLITSRTIKSPNEKIKVALNSTSAKRTSAQRFLNDSNGASINQIAVECKDIFKAAANLSPIYQLKISNNYYLDIQAQFDLEDELIEKLQRNNILYTEDDTGRFFHFYTKEVNGLFFEVVQRVGNYKKYGETNAFIRLASQSYSD
ncbi:bifunctional sugar phosphate isomerase/epimerase/4-hydroxyphenylpyruvate dioxygenase family protein [Vibrio campbellii]|uniref:bifunctional sugar phosphate isomerase/epimerase/4-hydroxyphenylpyruvate dioxygenase family protein n=1 Tax=Vibrio campbellii TaxID=680 RepID=UPI00015430DB|nr:sugar phosphate isomerase/epimerase and 4-hydroxyphenylpyruvate domain-containing protein [Vibrio campbellii]EDL70806.1 4-hydroxyphenylpyruvate dioxygenase [Vibrio campbellii HY01]MCE7732500.1 TIM barrel protein [Vibrio campbellii]